MKKTRQQLLTNIRNIGTVHNRVKADTSLIDVENRTIPFVIVSNNNSGLRYDWWNDEVYEERLAPEGATLDNLNTFFKDHEMRVDNAIGKVTNKRIEDGQIKADVVFGSDEESEKIFNKFREGILTDVSIGYTIQEIELNERDNDHDEVVVTKFDIHELSAVWKGFDSSAKVGRNKENLKKEGTPNEESVDLKKQRLRRLELFEKQI